MRTAVRSFVIAAGIFLASCGRPAATNGDESALSLSPCHVEGTDELLRCGTYFAREDRNIAGGRRLPLKVVVVPARKPGGDMTPIIYFQGGPGSPAAPEASFLARSPLRERHDIVLIDQRGTAGEHRLGCRGPGNDGDMGSWLESAYKAPYPALCRVTLEKRADLRLYTTPIAMQDYDEIRTALGYGKVNLLGGSYGSRAALIYLKMFGKNVRSAVVLGLVPLQARLPLYHPGGAQKALERVFAECAADAACRAAFPDPRGDFARVRARLREKPATVELKHPETGAALRVRLTEERLLGAVRAMLYSLPMQRQLPLALHRAAQGDYGLLAPGAIFARGANQTIAAGMALSVTCSEDVARIRPADIARETQGAFLGARFVEERVEACAHWPAGRLPNDHFKAFKRPTPVLIVTGSHDPVTPQWMADAYARHFPNSRHLVVPSGHSLPDGECLNRIEAEFFETADLRGLNTTCVAALRVPPFALPK